MFYRDNILGYLNQPEIVLLLLICNVNNKNVKNKYFMSLIFNTSLSYLKHLPEKLQKIFETTVTALTLLTKLIISEMYFLY